MNRLIPILLLHDNEVMKSVKFKNWRYIGDAINSLKILNEKTVDEVVILDVDASRNNREPDYNFLADLAGECFAPIGYGGGVVSADVANKVVSCGIDKVIVNSAFIENPGIVSHIASEIGSSSTVVSIDVVKRESAFRAFSHLAGVELDRKLDDIMRIAEEEGAGEILIQNVDRDGTRLGPDPELVQLVVSNCKLPIVYAGGVSSWEGAVEVWREGVGGVGAGSWFLLREPHDAVLVSYPSLQSRLREQTIQSCVSLLKMKGNSRYDLFLCNCEVLPSRLRGTGGLETNVDRPLVSRRP